MGQLRINNKSLDTPHYFPVMSFFCGGTQKSRFGGGPYRAIKEDYLTKQHTSMLFRGVITSITQLYDFSTSKERMIEYLSKTISEWFNYDGIVFVDSGGYRLLSKEDSTFVSSFKTKKAMRTHIQERQRNFGADIYVPLDFPAAPTMPIDQKKERWKFSIDSHIFSVENRLDNSLLYAVIHGHDKKEVDNYIKKLEDRLVRRNLDLSVFDGFAIGGLVPVKNNYLKVAKIFDSVKQNLLQRELGNKPIHMFGLGTLMIPLLSWRGADTFDSLSYLYAAIHRRYLLPNLTTIRIEKLKKPECQCPICSNEDSWKIMRNEKTKYAYHRVTPLAMHNLWVLQQEVNEIKRIIREEDDFTKHLNALTSGNSRLTRIIDKLHQMKLSDNDSE